MAFNENTKLILAKEFTTLAIQHGLITKHTNVEETAKAVSKFYKNIYDTIEPEQTNKQ